MQNCRALPSTIAFTHKAPSTADISPQIQSTMSNQVQATLKIHNLFINLFINNYHINI